MWKRATAPPTNTGYAVVDSQVLNGFDYDYFVTTVSQETIEYAGAQRIVRNESPLTGTFDGVDALTDAASAWLLANEDRTRRVSTAAAPSVLVKGSRFMRMERVVAALCGVDPAEGAH